MKLIYSEMEIVSFGLGHTWLKSWWQHKMEGKFRFDANERRTDFPLISARWVHRFEMLPLLVYNN